MEEHLAYTQVAGGSSPSSRTRFPARMDRAPASEAGWAGSMPARGTRRLVVGITA